MIVRHVGIFGLRLGLPSEILTSILETDRMFKFLQMASVEVMKSLKTKALPNGVHNSAETGKGDKHDDDAPSNAEPIPKSTISEKDLEVLTGFEINGRVISK